MKRDTPGEEKPIAAARMLQPTAVPDFLIAAHEWRRLFSEAWGTFLEAVWKRRRGSKNFFL
jgi:hypothetical protein